ncbi:MAG: hypothetical protein HOB55_04180 [Euryarchaeota archaeon]|jgi:hypothetical protein|nr:hypothetical protein [Euryarchaeota archaeon]
MGKLMTLRGQFSIDDNERFVEGQIFSYEANNLTRGWKVKNFYWWPASLRGETGTADGQFMIAATLYTDSTGSMGFDDISGVADNRAIAWVQRGYNRRNSAVADFITTPTGLEDNRALLDPDHIVNNALFINAYSTSDSSTSPERIYNYYVELEEIKLTPAQAILSIIKGKAQDIDN